MIGAGQATPLGRGDRDVSYLNPLRLHFSGSFQAAISTVNNDPVHCDSASFQRSYQQPQSGDELNGWFSPGGSGDWRLADCVVTAAFLADGTPARNGDPVRAAIVADSDRASPAKLVDLDPEQQMVSMIFGLEIRVVGASGDTLVRGRFEPAAFTDIWDRSLAAGVPGDFSAGAAYQSALTGLEWGEAGASEFLRQLRRAAGECLSVKFNVDGINLDPGSPHFLAGRVVGTIGPGAIAEPRHFVPGRQLMTTQDPAQIQSTAFFRPVGAVNFCAGLIDRSTRRVYLDLGNALPTGTPGGPLVSLGDLTLCRLPTAQSGTGQSQGPAAGEPTPPPGVIGVLKAAKYADAGTVPAWYDKTGGIAVFPPDRPLTDAELAGIDAAPLALFAAAGARYGGAQPAGGQEPGGTAVAAEPADGLFVRADQFVFRLDPGEEAAVGLYATRFGRPLPDAGIVIVPVPEQLQPFTLVAGGQAPPVAVPADAIEYPPRVVTGEDGIARLTVRARDPGRPRGYIDGQVYALYPRLEDTQGSPLPPVLPDSPYPFNQWNFVSLLLWSGFTTDEPPTWHGSVLGQYANLYPVMRDFLDLGDYESVCAHAKLLALAFGLDAGNPNSMPVTRDLSAAKRAAIVRWLSEPGADGKPLLGTPPGPTIAAAGPAPAGATGPAGNGAGTDPRLGGKAAAASRRRRCYGRQEARGDFHPSPAQRPAGGRRPGRRARRTAGRDPAGARHDPAVPVRAVLARPGP